MPILNKISPNELAVLSNAIAIILATDNSANDNNVLGNFLITVGTIIVTISAQQQSLETLNNNK
jgi:uncharacterized membrane protein